MSIITKALKLAKDLKNIENKISSKEKKEFKVVWAVSLDEFEKYEEASIIDNYYVIKCFKE